MKTKRRWKIKEEKKVRNSERTRWRRKESSRSEERENVVNLDDERGKKVKR